MRAALGLCILLLALAGCADAGVQAHAPEAPAGTASVSGQVLDDEARPLVGARVELVVLPSAQVVANSSTNATGRFEFGALEAGKYVVGVSKTGFRSATKTLTVPDGAPMNVELVLEPAQILVPFHTSFTYDNWFRYSVCVTAPTLLYCTVASSTANRTKVWINDEQTNGPLASLVVESTWETISDACPGTMRVDVYSPQQDTVQNPGTNGYAASADASNPYHWDNRGTKITNPTHQIIHRDGGTIDAMHSGQRTQLNDGKPILVAGKWKFNVWPTPDTSKTEPAHLECTYETKVAAWITAFYVERATDDFSILQA